MTSISEAFNQIVEKHSIEHLDFVPLCEIMEEGKHLCDGNPAEWALFIEPFCEHADGFACSPCLAEFQEAVYTAPGVECYRCGSPIDYVRTVKL